MHRFSRMHLSAADAIRKLDVIDLEEKSRVAEGIALIAVIDHRRDYLQAGYASMCDYCMKHLHISEDRALKRIQVARVALRFPEVFEYLADGRLCVSTAATLAPHLEPESASELLTASAFRPRHEILQVIADRARLSTLASDAVEGGLFVETSSESHAPGHVNSLEEPFEPAAGDSCTGPVAPAQASHARRGRILSFASGGHEVRLSLTEEEHADLRQAQSLLGHAVPSGDPAIIYARAMKHYLTYLEKQRLGAKPASAKAAPRAGGRGIPKALRRFVIERDSSRCAFVSADGHRCESTRRLEIDHIQPVALGGETKPDNLRLLCRAHNQHEAERVLGKEQVQRAKELAQRARARAKAAKNAAAAKTRAREAAKHRHHDDILAALGGLGFHKAEAVWGAELAATMPHASLEVCVRHALTSLTRAVAMRGERRARCTA
jgi:5-methylcytosine-specific restriction endonuclease McrA